jgi:hypothetical protein
MKDKENQLLTFATVEMCRSLKINTAESMPPPPKGAEGRGKEGVECLFNESTWGWLSLHFISIFTE